jgi:hypothetical protein
MIGAQDRRQPPGQVGAQALGRFTSGPDVIPTPERLESSVAVPGEHPPNKSGGGG